LLDNAQASAANSRPKHDNAGDAGARVRRDKRWLSRRRRWTRSLPATYARTPRVR